MNANKGNGRKSPSLKNSAISERLKTERQEALKILDAQAKKTSKATNKLSANMPASTASTSRSLLNKKGPVNKENLTTNKAQKKDNFATPITNPNAKKLLHPTNMSARSTLLESNQTNTELNKTEYVPRKYHELNDISELLLLDSITLSSGSLPTPKDTTPNVSFNPNEMTGRSTLHKRDSVATQQLKRGSLLSIDEILMQSTVPSVRERRKSTMGCATSERNSVASSCISNFSAMQKNPRPTSSQESSSAEGNFSFGQEMQKAQNNVFVDESFAPTEQAMSRIAHDEIDWAYEKLPIPTAKLLSKEAKATFAAKETQSKKYFDHTLNSNMSAVSSNTAEMSVGQFFQLHSEDVGNILKAPSPPRDRRTAPYALICDDTVTTTTMNTSNTLELAFCEDDYDKRVISKTQATEEKRTYQKLVPKSCSEGGIRDSKDSGNATGKSLDPLVLAAPVTQNEIIQPADNQISVEPLHGLVSALVGAANAAQSGNSVDFLKHAEKLQLETEEFLENKENIEAFKNHSKVNAGSTTLSFTDSLLNTSIQNYRMSSVGQARAPLSPIPITFPDRTESDEADIDEYVNSPLMAAQNRRKRFSKSPNHQKQKPVTGSANCNGVKLPEFILIDYTDEEDDVPIAVNTANNKINEKGSEEYGSKQNFIPDHKTPVRRTLEGNNTVPEKTETEVGGIVSSGKTNKTLTPNQNTNNSGGVIAKHTFELSPLSSPRSYLSSPLGSISLNGCCQCSPNFDRTNNSDKRYLSPTMTETNGLRRVASSPSSSVASAPTGCDSGAISKYGVSNGVPPMRTYSSNSVKSIESTSTRSVSRCSNNSEFTHRDGRILPLKATALELAWGSVKLHKASQKHLQIRNTSNKRLVVRVLTYGPGFQLLSPDSNLLTLTSQECRTIVINFCPTVLGAAIGKLSFQPPRVLNNSKGSSNELIIPLYAYGGNASIHIQNIIRGPLNLPFFPIGDWCELILQPLESEIRIYNKGPLLGFAFLNIEPSGGPHVPGLCSAFRVHPKCTLIAPNSVETIKLIFAPCREDLKKIKKNISEVFTLAKMRIIYGDEPMRQRLRQINMLTNVRQCEQDFSKSLDMIWTHIPGEETVEDLDRYKEETSVASDIWSCLTEHVAAITLNNNMQDETAAELSTIFSDADNTILFRTVYLGSSPTPQLETVHEHQEDLPNNCNAVRFVSETVSSSTSIPSDSQVYLGSSPTPQLETVHEHQEDLPNNCNAGECVSEAVSSSTSVPRDSQDNGRLLFTVMPAAVDFDLRTERVPIIVCNNFKSPQFFTVACNHPNLLYFLPDHGYIEPNGGEITVYAHTHPDARKQRRLPNDVAIMVYMDSEKIIVPVRVPLS